VISGSGDIIEPDDGVLAIGSGGPYAMAAGLALLKHSDLSARDIALEALRITSDICVFTNDRISIVELP
jgi:ATP-dependent HslUV protease subunit HslV